MKPYPTRDGLPVPVDEVYLPPSRLDPSNEYNYNRHHYYYSARMYERSILLTTLRNLETSQVMMLKDQHNMGRTALHSLYSPPRMPKISRVMEHLEKEKEAGTMLMVGSKGKYTPRKFSDGIWGQIKRDYDRAC